MASRFAGNGLARTALYAAAHLLLIRSRRWPALRARVRERHQA